MVATTSHDMLTVMDHPLIHHKLTIMRKIETPASEFRRLLREISAMMTAEVTRQLPVDPIDIVTPVCPTQGWVLSGPPPVVVPVLRAGLGMSDGVMDVLTEADVGHIGVYRDEETVRPVEYLVRMPKDIENRTIIVTDPMLATGYSGAHAVAVLLEKGARPENIVFMALVAAPEGVQVFSKIHPKVRIVTASLDERLNEKSYIVPGLGDAGDRVFGTY